MPKKRAAPAPDLYEHIRPSEWRPAHPLAYPGVTGPLAPGRVEHLQRRRDQDRARWLGVQSFTRPATAAERVYVARRLGASDAHTGALDTRVTVLGDSWRRSWPMFGAWEHETIHTTNPEEGAA